VRGHDPELNVLKAAIERRAFDDAVFRGLRGEHFRDDSYGRVWDYLREHHRRFGVVPAQETVLIDFPNLRDYLLYARASEPVGFYADKILEAFTRSGVAEKLAHLLPLLESDVATGMEEISKTVADYRLIRQNTAILTLANTASERQRLYQSEKVYGVPYGWDTLDALTHGAHPGELVVLVARAGMGKTWLTIKCAHTAWKDGQRVLFIATEVPAMTIFSRFDALHLGLDYNLYKSRMLVADEQHRFDQYFVEQTSAGGCYEDFIAVDGTGLSPSGLSMLIDRLQPDIVFIDSFYKLEPDKRYDTRQGFAKIQHLADELKDNVAMRHKIPVFLNAQFNREVGTVMGGAKHVEGGLEHIAGGDHLGKQADLVLAVSRSLEEMQQQALKVKVIKGREIEDGKSFHISFDFRKLGFREINLNFLEGDEERGAKFGGGEW
jgi:archaellum biogenesis ATPase FlaH